LYNDKNRQKIDMEYLSKIAALLIFAPLCFTGINCNSNRQNGSVNININSAPFQKISDYGFFKDVKDFSRPNKGVIPYKLVNSMFNDYSSRASFVFIPDGQSAGFDSTNLLDLPVGSCLINVVYYNQDAKNISSGKNLIETQLLMRKQTGWEPFDYIWNDDQKEAILSESGASKPIKRMDKNGSAKQIDFDIPARMDCKLCHWSADRVTPIGIKAGNLNLDLDYPSGKKNQLTYWTETGLLKAFDKSKAAQYQNWEDTSFPLEQRARYYLDANCAHCHNPRGPASISGLFLNYDNYNMLSYGIMKTPRAGGRATCYLKYDINPAKPSESVTVCRMSTTEFGVKMPELGRTLVDTEGVSLIIRWIAQLKGDSPVK
jgi:uncharacterized repeat protein (TIGR03806 family)